MELLRDPDAVCSVNTDIRVAPPPTFSPRRRRRLSSHDRRKTACRTAPCSLCRTSSDGRASQPSRESGLTEEQRNDTEPREKEAGGQVILLAEDTEASDGQVQSGWAGQSDGARDRPDRTDSDGLDRLAGYAPSDQCRTHRAAGGSRTAPGDPGLGVSAAPLQRD